MSSRISWEMHVDRKMHALIVISTSISPKSAKEMNLQRPMGILFPPASSDPPLKIRCSLRRWISRLRWCTTWRWRRRAGSSWERSSSPWGARSWTLTERSTSSKWSKSQWIRSGDRSINQKRNSAWTSSWRRKSFSLALLACNSSTLTLSTTRKRMWGDCSCKV